MTTAPLTVVVAGMGDVGTRAAALLAADGHHVVGVRRSDVTPPDGVGLVRGDLRDPDLAARLPADVDVVLATVSSDGRDPDLYRAAYVDGPTTLVAGLAARGDAVRRVVFTSSSAVYGQRDGEWVDEDSPTEPSSATAEVLVEAEHALADGPFPATSLRLTGIYGPGRTRLLETVADGDAVVGTSPRWTNRIHAADAGAAAALLATLEQPPPVVVGTDDEPVDAREVYEWLAARLGVEGPVVDDDRAPDRGSKRCRNDLLRSLGWVPAYPTFREGYAQVLADWSPDDR